MSFVKTQDKRQESLVTSPVLHLNKNETNNTNKDSLTRIQVYPAVAVLINTFGEDGTLKNAVAHFQPDFSPDRASAEENEGGFF